KIIEEVLHETHFDLEKIYDDLNEELNFANKQEELHEDILKFNYQLFKKNAENSR
ncbi:36911_t:CDS:1, partial [Racocetra persica]